MVQCKAGEDLRTAVRAQELESRRRREYPTLVGAVLSGFGNQFLGFFFLDPSEEIRKLKDQDSSVSVFF